MKKQTKLAPPRKRQYHLEGGPLAGAGVYLTTPSTLVFKCRGERGRYVAIGDNPKALKWEPV